MTSDHPGDPAADHPDDRRTLPEEGPMDETTTRIDDTSATGAVGDTAPARRRSLDHTSLVAGVVVLLIAAAFAFGDPDSVREQGRLIGPLVLLGIGAALLIGSLRR